MFVTLVTTVTSEDFFCFIAANIRASLASYEYINNSLKLNNEMIDWLSRS